MPVNLLQKKTLLIRSILSCVFMMTVIMGCSDDKTKVSAAVKPKQVPLNVSVITVHTQKYPLHIEVVGQTEGSKEIEVRSRINGWIKKQRYSEGSVVQAGQVLFELDRRPLEINVSQANATLQEAKARITQATREYKRLKLLLPQQAVSQKEVDDAQTTLQVATATEQRTQATLREAHLNLSYATVTAPVSGLSGRASKTEGNLVGTTLADSLLTSIVQINPIRARFSISENDLERLGIAHLTPSQLRQAELILPDGNTYPFSGKLDFVANQIEPTLGTRGLRALFPNPKGQLLPGQFIRIRLFTTQEHEVVMIPQVAVSQTEKGFNVFVVNKENSIALRPVQIGEWKGSNWIITGGLQNGDRVVIDQVMKLKPNMNVIPHIVSDQLSSKESSSLKR